MRRRTLECQADRIEAVLAKHKVPGRVSGGLVSPRWIKFNVIPALGARVSKVKGLAEELALALNSDSCRVSRQGNVLAVELPRSDPRPIRLLPLQKRLTETRARSSHGQRAGIPFGTALLGLAEDGAPLLVRLPSPDVAHLLIAGTTGSGKTALARTLIASLALNHRRAQLGFVLIDPKGRAFEPLVDLPHLLRPVLRRPEEAGRALADLVEVMLERDRERRCEPRVVVVIDELADLLMSAGSEAAQALTRLAQRGREAGVHLIAGTQKPASSVVGSLAKANFPVRLVGRVTSAHDALCAAGIGGSGAERLSGRGDFLAIAAGAGVTRFQAAYISEGELKQMVREMGENGR